MIKSIIKLVYFFIIIFNIILSQDHWETAIYADDEWSYLVPIEEPQSDWNSLNFNDDAWLIGTGGFGYGDDDDGTEIEPALSVYLRKSFFVEDIDNVLESVLHSDYDDGFIAYINGNEIGRSYNLGNYGDEISFDHGTNGQDHEAQLYQDQIPEYTFVDSLSLLSILIEGQNLLAIQVHNININSSDLSSNFFLSFKIEQGYSFFGDTPNWFSSPITFDQSNLPIIMIDTYGSSILDDPRIPAYMGIINNIDAVNYTSDPFNNYDGHITIELRGNSSQYNEKKPYRIETVDSLGENNNVSLLGMPEENDWVLYAPYQDKTLIRNVLAYKLSNELGRYASRTRHCELYINEDYKGVYVLMEKIKRDDNRVNISKLQPDEISGDDLTGGYILKFDWPWTGDNLGGFESENDGMIYNYHYPKPSDIVPEQEEYIIDYIHSFENIMLSNDYTDLDSGYPSILNANSFVDFILLQELSKNVDAYRLSTYIYKDKESIDDRLTAGPIWDFNHGFGNCDYGETWISEGWLLDYNPEGGDQMAFWWELLWADENFKNQVANRYTQLRLNIFSDAHIHSIIDSVQNYMGESIDRNFNRWPILGQYIWPNYYVFDTYDEEINYFKSWISDRLDWMDNQILLSNDLKVVSKNYILGESYPNPFNPTTNIPFFIQKDTEVLLSIYDINGRLVESLLDGKVKAGSRTFKWNASEYHSGLYFIKMEVNDLISSKKVMLVK